MTNTINIGSLKIDFNIPNNVNIYIKLAKDILEYELESQEWRQPCLVSFLKYFEPKIYHNGVLIDNNIIEYLDNNIPLKDYAFFTNEIRNIFFDLCKNTDVSNNTINAVNNMAAVIIDLQPYISDETKYNSLKHSNSHRTDASTLLATQNKEGYDRCIDGLTSGELSREEYVNKILLYAKPHIQLFCEKITQQLDEQHKDNNFLGSGVRTAEEIENMVKNDTLSPTEKLTPEQEKISRTNTKKMVEKLKQGAYSRYIPEQKNG